MQVILTLVLFSFSVLIFGQNYTSDTVRFESGAIEVLKKYSDNSINKTFILSNGEIAYSNTFPGIDTVFNYDSSYSVLNRNINGLLDGEQKYYYSNDAMRSNHYYSKGLNQGTSIYYSSKGIKTGIWPYKNGSVHGNVLLNHENGNALFKGNYISGQPSGQRTFYDSLGNPFSGFGEFPINDDKWFVTCKNGVPEGETHQFDNLDRVIMSGYYKNGGLHGILIFFDTLGIITDKDLFINGEYVSSIMNDPYSSILGLQKLINLEQENIEYRAELFKIQYQLKNTTLALKELNQILKIDSNNVDAIYNKGVIEFERDSFDRSKELFEKAIAIDKKYCRAIYNLGLVEYKLDNNKRALRYFKKAKNCAPEFVGAKHNINKLKEIRKYSRF